MQSTIAVHHVTLTPAERVRLSALDERIQHYFRKIFSLRWVIRESETSVTASFDVHALSGHYRATARCGRVGAALDLAFDKVVRQRTRTHVRAVTLRNRAGALAKADGHDIERE